MEQNNKQKGKPRILELRSKPVGKVRTFRVLDQTGELQTYYINKDVWVTYHLW